MIRSKHPAMRRHELFWLSIAIVLCAQFSLQYVMSGSVTFIDFEAYARGLEAVPYQNRVLMSWVLALVQRNEHIFRSLTNMARHAPAPLSNPYVLVTALAGWLSLVVGTIATRGTLLNLGANRAFASKASLSMLALLSFLIYFVGYGHYVLPYDIPSVGFFCVGVFLITSRRLGWLVPLCLFAALNRETSIFITVFFLLFEFARSREEGRSFFRAGVLTSGAAQLIAWGLTRVLTHKLFGNNPHAPGVVSGTFITHLGQNLHSLAKPTEFPDMFSLALFLCVPAYLAWRARADHALVQASAIATALWVIAMMVVGVLVEVRIFGELVAWLSPCLAVSLCGRFHPEPELSRVAVEEPQSV